MPAATYRETFFFGDSLSDTGSNAYLVDRLLGPFTSRSLRTEVPIPSPTYVAGYPYATGRYSNGPVWAEYFAAAAIRMNSAIVTAAQGLPESVLRDVRGFDVFGVMNEVIAFPGRFRLTDVTTACAYIPSCIADPSTSLYWDGLHPTTRGHEILASAVLASPTPEPGVVVLLGVGIAVVAIRLRPWRSRRSVRRLGV